MERKVKKKNPIFYEIDFIWNFVWDMEVLGKIYLVYDELDIFIDKCYVLCIFPKCC